MSTTCTPFAGALGRAADRLDPAVRSHFLLPPGSWRCAGVMRRVWRRGGWAGAFARPFLWLASLTDSYFTGTGTDVPFELVHHVGIRRAGQAGMTWHRTFHFGRRRQCFDELMYFDDRRGRAVVLIGRTRHLEADLHARVEEGGVAVTSGRQRLRVGPLRIPLPHWLVGRADVREWRTPGGRLAVRVTIDNPLLGAFVGYEGEFDAAFEPA